MLLAYALRARLIAGFHAAEANGMAGRLGRWVVRFSLLAALASAAYGALAFLSLALGRDAVVDTIVLVATAAMAGALAGRNAVFPRIALIQIALALGPMALGAALAPDRGFLALTALALFFYGGLIRVIRERHEQLVGLILTEAQLDTLSQTDALTGIANRRRFDEWIERAWRDARFAGAPLSVLMVDVDHFKRFNDAYGHLAGDDCLRAVATALRNQVRRHEDLVARFGGEEFAILLHHTSIADAEALADELCAAVARLAVPHRTRPDAHSIVTVSIGVASTCLAVARTANHLLALADEALYVAKREGRARAQAWVPEPDDERPVLAFRPKRPPVPSIVVELGRQLDMGRPAELRHGP
jgi:diguanylate cyclase (GGDEF)-like protein